MKNLRKILINFSKKYFPKNKPSLLKIVNEEKKTNKQVQEVLKKKTEPLWIPSFSSFFKIFISILIFWFIAHPQYFYNWFLHPVNNLIKLLLNDYDSAIYFLDQLAGNLPSWQIQSLALDANHYQNLIAIHAGIGAVLIGLAFFVAQSLTDKNDPERGKVLLYKSYFFPLLTAEILVFCFFLWGDTNILSLIPVIIVAIFTIISLARVIIILIKDFEMEKAKREMFFKIIRDGFIRILDWEITKRVGSNKLFEKFKDDKKIDITPFGPFDKEKYLSIKSNKSGIFYDLSFLKLEKFLLELSKFFGEKESVSSDFDSEKTKKNTSDLEKDPFCVLTSLFRSEIKAGDTIIWIKKSLFDNKIKEEKERLIKDLSNLANNILNIREVVDPEKEARSEISKLKDRCILAISNKQTGELEKIIHLYIDLAKEFFNYIELYGGGFSQEQAEKERGAFFERLKPVEWLSRDIREIFERGMQSKDREIIREVAYLPIILARYAIDHKDHLIFQEFIYFPQLLYSHAYEEKLDGNNKLSEFMFDRAWRYLKELSDYHLEPKMKDGDFDEENFKGFAIYILKIFQNLLRESFKNEDIENFSRFLTTAQKIFKHLDRSYYSHNSKKDKNKDVFDYLSQRRKQMFFGLASWILHKFEIHKDNPTLKSFYNDISNKLPSNLPELTTIFIDSHDFKTEDFWGWDNWELQEKEEGEVHSIRILEKLEKFYAIKSLIILSGKSQEEIKKIQLPPSRDLAFLAEGTRELIKILNDIKENPKKWEFVLNDNAVQKIDDFKNLLSKAKTDQEGIETETKKTNPISSKKVKEFKEKIVDSFYEAASIREIFISYLKKYKNKINEKWIGDKGRFGINIVDNKAAFFENWYVHYSGWGDNYGRDMALGENSNLLDEISKNCVDIKTNDFNSKIKECDNLKDLFIFVTDSLVLWDDNFQKLINFLPHYQSNDRLEIKGFVGWAQINNIKIPVFEIFYRGKERKKEILILNKSKLGSLVQHSPLNDSEDNNLIKDIFYINVQSFSEDSEFMDNFIKNNPPQWLTEIGTETDQKEHLKERVLIYVFERFSFIKHEDFKGLRIKL